MWDLQPTGRAPFHLRRLPKSRSLFPILALWLAISALQVQAKDTAHYGAGLIVSVPFPEAQVTMAVEEVTQNGIIRGSKEYDREEYITGAELATSVRGFPEWQEGGKVFYKVRNHALDPRNFKESGDVGTLAVRYVIQAQGDKNTVVHIDAIFVEDFRHAVHLSNGSVEAAEYKEIHDHVEALEVLRKEGAESKSSLRPQVNEKLLRDPASLPALSTRTQASTERQSLTETAQPAELSRAQETPEQLLQSLRRQVQRIVKSPGAPLKASPFRTAKTLVSLPSGTEVLIVISTTYWYGVETHAGQHGWVFRDDLELLP